MSPRAAWRLESMEFGEVFDYVGSKMDWIGDGLPFEGDLAGRPRLSTLAHVEVPTGALHETLGDVRDRLGRWPFCLVVGGPERVVLGLARADASRGNDGRTLSEVMEEGPSTYRPHVTATSMSTTLRERPASWVLVTTLSGHLVGVALPDDIHAAASKDGA